MKTKIELLEDINKIPLFTLREVAVKENDWIEDKAKKVVTEEDKTNILTLVSNRYELVQFKEVYEPLINEFEDLSGFIKYYEGAGILVIYPEGETFKIGNENIGILVNNSVDKTSSVNVKFVISEGDYTVIIPEKNGLKAIHIGSVKKLVSNYEYFITKVRESWKTILEKLKNRFLDDDEVDELFKKIQLTKKVRKQIRRNVENNNLWDLFIEIVKEVSNKEYKNEVNQFRKLEKISKVCYEFCLVESI